MIDSFLYIFFLVNTPALPEGVVLLILYPTKKTRLASPEINRGYAATMKICICQILYSIYIFRESIYEC